MNTCDDLTIMEARTMCAGDQKAIEAARMLKTLRRFSHVIDYRDLKYGWPYLLDEYIPCDRVLIYEVAGK